MHPFYCPVGPILAGFSYGADGFYDARNTSTAGHTPRERNVP